MTDRIQLPPFGRFDLFQHPGRLDIAVFDDSVLVGHVFPAVVPEPDGDWFARRPGKPAVRCPTRDAALAHLAGQPAETQEF